MTRVLVVEDEPQLRNTIVRSLRFEGCETVGARDGDEALRAIAERQPDLIVTDIRMPTMSGIELVTALRDNPTTRLIPVIMLTAVPDRSSQRQSMELGANDYITKPFQMEELFGAVAAQLRRRQWQREHEQVGEGGEVIEFAQWRYDIDRRLLSALDGTGAERQLTVSEGRLLMALIEQAGRTIPRQELLDRMGRPAASPLDRSVDVFINHLRQKIEEDARHPILLKTVRSVGYIFDLPREQIRRLSPSGQDAPA